MFSKCPSCGTPYKSDTSKFCHHCGIARPNPVSNHCTNPECEKFNVELRHGELYCDICGAPTSVRKWAIERLRG